MINQEKWLIIHSIFLIGNYLQKNQVHHLDKKRVLKKYLILIQKGNLMKNFMINNFNGKNKKQINGINKE